MRSVSLRLSRVEYLPLLAVGMAWALMFALPMRTEGFGLIAGWITMVIAMMVPTVLRPMRRLADGSQVRTLGFLIGYTSVWLLTAIPALWLMNISMASSFLSGLLWVAAGVVQIAPGTAESLHSCRRLSKSDHPLTSGLRQDLWCQRGCFLVMVAAMTTAMQLNVVGGLLVMAGATALMVWEKWHRATLEQVRAVGAALVMIGAAVILFAPAMHMHP